MDKRTEIGASTSSPQSKADPLASLNFKVPLHIRSQFKIYAARRNMSMTEVLLHLLADCLAADEDCGDGGLSAVKQEIKK